MTTKIEEITAIVLRNNLDTLKTTPQDYEKVMNAYGKIFFDKLKEKNKQITVGLQIGLTKRYFEFLLNNISKSERPAGARLFDEYFKKASGSAINNVTESLNENATVYVTYRNLKKCIDKECAEILEMYKWIQKTW